LREEGDIKLEGEITQTEGPDEVYDESGNKIDVKKRQQLKPSDAKKAIKDIEKKLSAHKQNNNLADEDLWELTDKLAELKASLKAQK